MSRQICVCVCVCVRVYIYVYIALISFIGRRDEYNGNATALKRKRFSNKKRPFGESRKTLRTRTIAPARPGYKMNFGPSACSSMQSGNSAESKHTITPSGLSPPSPRSFARFPSPTNDPSKRYSPLPSIPLPPTRGHHARFPHDNALQRAATRCNTLQHAAMRSRYDSSDSSTEDGEMFSSHLDRRDVSHENSICADRRMLAAMYRTSG